MNTVLNFIYYVDSVELTLLCKKHMMRSSLQLLQQHEYSNNLQNNISGNECCEKILYIILSALFFCLL